MGCGIEYDVNDEPLNVFFTKNGVLVGKRVLLTFCSVSSFSSSLFVLCAPSTYDCYFLVPCVIDNPFPTRWSLSNCGSPFPSRSC
jgi:hypothetical protein